MSLKRLLAGGVAAAILGFVAGPANAVLMTATFKGKVSLVHYTDLTFGTYNLAGLDYTAVWTFDTARGADSLYVPLPGYFDLIRAGSNEASPVRSLSIFINGETDVIDFSSPSNSYSGTERINNPAQPRGQLSFNGQAGRTVPSPTGGDAYDYSQVGSNFTAPTVIPFELDQPWTPLPGTGTSGFLRQVQNAGRGYDQAYNFQGTVTSVRVAELTAGVPEPGAWTLMIGGFSAAGAMLRRREGQEAI